MGRFAEYERYDGLGLAELVRNGATTPRELAEAAIDRIESINPQVNAVIDTWYDAARQTASHPLPQGPFTGVPFLLKDLLAAYAGVPLRRGSRFHENDVPAHDSEIVRRYKAAGVIILGKTNIPEYALAPMTEPELFGPTNNPWDLSRSPGGSSGGAAAAVAACLVPMAHGGDGGGSIRVPASCCGVFGLKPTRGRTPSSLDVEIWQGLACEHVLTRTVRDSAAMLDATAGPSVGAPYDVPSPARPFLEEVGAEPGTLRIAFTEEPLVGESVHEDCRKALQAAVVLCESLGHEVVPIKLDIERRAFRNAFLTMLCGEARADMEEACAVLRRRASSRDFEDITWALGLLGRHLSAATFTKAIRQMQRTSRDVGRRLEGFDVFMTPTLAMPPVKTGFLMPGRFEAFTLRLLTRLNAGWLLDRVGLIEAVAEKSFAFTPNTTVFNATGQPAMSVPLCWNDEGLPIGIQFVGRYADEATLFRLAGQLERAQPWVHRYPPILGTERGPRTHLPAEPR